MNRQPVEEWKQNQRDAEKMQKLWQDQEMHKKLQELLRPGLQPLMPTPTPPERSDEDKYAFAFQLDPKLVAWVQPKPKPKPPKQLLIELRGGPMDGAEWTMPADVTGAYRLAWPEGAEYRPEFDSIDNLWHYTYYGPEDLP